MNIRQATGQDIPSIVELLKLSLGESLLPKSEAYWMWKHVNNPFGGSPVLLAFEDEAMIGVRAFMRWQWTSGGIVLPAVRAVDTATHPQHQGKGIFKKLTLSLLDQCSALGDQFVFNTPNKNSKPGYLKMGWEEMGSLPIRVSVQRPASILKNLISASNHSAVPQSTMLSYWLDHPALEEFLTRIRSGQRITTAVSPHYLRWRYRDVPIVNYEAFGAEKNGKLSGILIGRIKSSRAGREFRITDFFSNDYAEGQSLGSHLREFIRSNDVDYCTCSGFVTREAIRSLKGVFFLPAISRGPIVTTRQINFGEMVRLKNFADWSPSLGDLELF